MMKIFIDALYDLPPEEQEEYGIVCLPYLFNINGKETLTSELSNKEVFELFKSNIQIKTSRPPLKCWREIIEKEFEEGNDIFYLASTSKMTGALSSANIIANFLLKKYSNRQFVSVDTLTLAGGGALLTREVSKLKTIPELKNRTDSLIPKIHWAGVIDSTSTIVKNNRYDITSSGFPFVEMKEGEFLIKDQYKTKEEAFDNLFDYVLKENPKKIHAIVSYDLKAPLRLNELADKISTMNPCMYSYLGTGTCVLAWEET